jgi:hypothetical protein
MSQGFSVSVLETLYKQEAARYVPKAGYDIIENYAPYEGLKIVFA